MLTRSPLIQAQRSLAAQAAVKRSAEGPAMQVKKLDNGLTVACLDTAGKLTTVGLVTKAGSRYEDYENAGISHTLRAALGLASSKFTGFGITRNVQQAGAHISAAGGRDYILYGTNFVRGSKNEHVLDYMFDAISNPKFRHWEIPAAHHRVEIQNKEVEPQAKAVELLHKAAYRDGLGNSVFCPEHMVGKHSCTQLTAFHQKHVTGERSVLAGINMDFNHLVDYASSLELEKGAGPSTSAKYYGGDVRVNALGGLAHVAIAVESGNPVTNVKEAMANYLLKIVLGDGQKVKYGVLSGKLSKSLPAEGLHAVTGLHCSYADSSLIGAFISTDAATAGENVTKVAQAMRSLNVTEQEFQAAKKALAIELAEASLDPYRFVEMLASHTLFAPEVNTVDGLHNLIGQVTLADVQAAAKKMSNGKLSLGATGNLANVPYVESL